MPCTCNKLYKVIFNDSFFKRSVRCIGTTLITTCLLPVTIPLALVETCFETCFKTKSTMFRRLVLYPPVLWLGLITVLPFLMAVGDAPLKCFKCKCNIE